MFKFERLSVDPIVSNDRDLIQVYLSSSESIILTHFQAMLLSRRLENVVLSQADLSGGERVADQGGSDCPCGNGKLSRFDRYEKPHYENYFMRGGQEGVFCTTCSSYFPRYVVRLSKRTESI